MKFKNQFNAEPIPQTFHDKSPELGYYIDENGERQFGIVGEIDDYANIQRHKDSCDYEILKGYLYAANPAPVGVYGVRPEQFSDINDFGAFKADFEVNLNKIKEVEQNANITKNTQNSEASDPPVEDNSGGVENE